METDRVFQGSIPALYDRYLGAEALAAATQVAAGAIAARYGSGPVTGQIRAHVLTATR